MGWSFYLMLWSGLGLVTLFGLFKAEAVKGQRFFLTRVRNSIDLRLYERGRRFEIWKRYVGASTFRLFLHYLAHQILSTILFTVRKLEKLVTRLRKHNRTIAKDVKNIQSENHLSHIAAHKASTTLSPEEQQALRERKLND